jgi:hypothetical protein
VSGQVAGQQRGDGQARVASTDQRRLGTRADQRDSAGTLGFAVGLAETLHSPATVPMAVLGASRRPWVNGRTWACGAMTVGPGAMSGSFSRAWLLTPACSGPLEAKLRPAEDAHSCRG